MNHILTILKGFMPKSAEQSMHEYLSEAVDLVDLQKRMREVYHSNFVM